MSAESEAYRFAQGLITEATVNRAEALSFDRPETKALTRLPPEIRFLDGLRDLDLSNTQLTDISDLRELGGLTELRLSNTQVSDLSPLAGMTGMTGLWLDNTQVSDLSPLAGMTRMMGLWLDNTQVSDLSPLAGMTGMRVLWLDNTQVSDLSPLAGMTGMTGLSLGNTQVSDLSPLAGMTGMTTLFLNDTQVSDLSSLVGMTGMTTLILRKTQVSDLSPLAGMTGMTELWLSNTQVSDLSPLAGMTGMTELWLGSTQVSDLSPLAGMTGITRLSLHNTQVSDLSPLAGMTGMTELSLVNSPVLDLRVLRNLKKLAESDGGTTGLTFEGTTATRADPRIAEIAEIEDNAERVRVLFDYLERWEVPVPKDSELAPSYIWPDAGPIRSKDAAPENFDQDQDDLREDLCRKARQLVGLIGDSNELAILKGAASHYLIQIDRPLSNIKLSLLYSAANTLRVAHEADLRAREQSLHNAQLPPKEGAALEDVVQTHALFFMGFANGHEIHARMTSGLTGVRNAQEIVAAEPIVTSLEAKFDKGPVALDQEDQAALADDLAAAKGEGPSAEIGGLMLRGRIGNLLGAIGRRIYGLGQFVTKEAAAALIGNAVVFWVVTNQVAIWAWLKLVQGAASGWFQRVLEVLQGLM
jgi:Leucine-rich repeat (LRR) protein